MLTVPTIFAIVGGILLLIGLIGGGIEVGQTRMPYLNIMTRLIAAVMGFMFLGISTLLSVSNEQLNSFPIAMDAKNKLTGFHTNPTTAQSPIRSTETTPPTTVNTVLLTIASSSTKQQWMEQVAKRFMSENKTIGNGKKIKVVVSSVSSGGSFDAILEGKLKPVVWSPGAISWMEQLEQRWKNQGTASLLNNPCQPVVYTPLGLAMWRPMAETLGWPNKPISWQTIVKLVSDHKGWGLYGHPEWGQFYLGHAHPKYGNSGLLTVASLIYSLTGKTNSLTPADIYAPQVETALRALAQNTAKYGLVTEDLINLMAREGPHYLHAVVTYESDAVRLNLERAKELRFPIAFVLPAGGTFWGSHPYCIFDKAEWVNEEQAESATLFLKYLLQAEQQMAAIDSLLRPLDSHMPLRPPLTLANGTDPNATMNTVPALTLPSAEVSTALIDVFMITKRKATILLLLDISYSMEGEKIKSATEATVNFLKRLQRDDRVGLITFSTQINVLTKPTPISEVTEELPNKIKTLLAKGNTALYQAVCQAHELMQTIRKTDKEIDENRLYGIVLLSDGADTSGKPTENQMFSQCLPTNAEIDGVKIFPIAFGKEANKTLLQRIADTTGGKLFTADPDSIEKVYLNISAEQ